MIDEARLNRLYRYGISLSNDESLSYDLLQDALESYLRLAPERRPEKGTDAYLRTCMRNRYIDQLRHQKRYPSHSLDVAPETLVGVDLPDPAQCLIDQQTLERILSALEPLERELLHLWAYEGMTAQEIADQVEAPRGTVLSRIHRLRKKILALGEQPDRPRSGGARV